MHNGVIEIVVKGDPASLANFFRAVSFYPVTACSTVPVWNPDKTPDGYHAAMEFERSRAERFLNPTLFERK